MGVMNVIVVVCNSLHLGFLGAYGNAWIDTPSLDRLAAEGVVFDHHFPENLTTLPTRRSWWTGRYGFADPDQGWTALRPDERDPARHPLRTKAYALPSSRTSRCSARSAWASVAASTRSSGCGARVTIRLSLRRIPARHVRLDDEPGLRLPPEEDPDHALWKSRWEQYLRNRAVLRADVEENTGVARTVKTAIDWLERRGGQKEPFVLWLDLFSPHGPWDPPQPYRDQYVMAEPDEFEAGEEGDLVEESGQDDEDLEIDIEDVAALIDVPAGAVGDVLSEAELFRLGGPTPAP